MQVQYNKPAIQGYISDTGNVGFTMLSTQDRIQSRYSNCEKEYQQLHGELQELAHRAWRRVYELEGELEVLENQYDAYMQAISESEDDYDYQNASGHAYRLEAEMRQVQEELDEARQEYEKFQEKLRELEQVRDTYAASAQSAQIRIDEGYSSFHSLSGSANRDLESYMLGMDQAQATLYDTSGIAGVGGVVSTAAAAGPSGIPAGVAGTVAAAGAAASAAVRKAAHWASVSRDSGRRTVSLSIGGSEAAYPLNKSGAARAYRKARASNDPEMIARCNTIFEIETLRETLELHPTGEDGILQVGGYHKDVKGHPGYESHHIPQQAAQHRNSNDLPAIALTKEDHKKTDSYAGKSRRVYKPFIPSNVSSGTYKQEVSGKIRDGDYISVVRNELYNLRDQFGHRYDGGIAQYLDTLVDMIATRGIPREK